MGIVGTGIVGTGIFGTGIFGIPLSMVETHIKPHNTKLLIKRKLFFIFISPLDFLYISMSVKKGEINNSVGVFFFALSGKKFFENI